LRSVRKIKAEYHCGITSIAHCKARRAIIQAAEFRPRIAEAVVCVLACATGDLLKYELN